MQVLRGTGEPPAPPILGETWRRIGSRVLTLLLLLLAGTPFLRASTNAFVLIPAGIHRPALRGPEDAREIAIHPFRLEIVPVTNGDYLAFVRSQPRWRRSAVKSLFADQNYLRHWADDLDPGSHANAGRRQPVTGVSWFAAKAYASWKGGRLPTTAEWEYAAAAGRRTSSLTNDPAYRQQIVRWYSTPTPPSLADVGSTPANFLGVQDLHGLIWEWTSDFNSALVSGDARGDTGIDRQLFCGAGALDASLRDDFPAYLRYGFRSSLKAAYTVHNLGFRCAFDPSTPVVSGTRPDSSQPAPAPGR